MENPISLEDYLTALGSSAPTPGGGSAAALVGALAASLVGMVADLTRRSERFATKAALADDVWAQSLQRYRPALERLRGEDETAYRAVVDAMNLPRGDGAPNAHRTAVLQVALERAAAVPAQVATCSAAVARCAQSALELGNDNLAGDLGCAASFALASVEAAGYNVRANHKFMKNAAAIEAQSEILRAAETEVRHAAQAVRAYVLRTAP